MHSISDLTTFCRKTTGDVPAQLVGASTTVVGSKMYLFGGRLVAERRMVSDLYMFDLETFHWEKLAPNPDDDIPGARYFHSADTWNNQLIIFGGMGNKFDSVNPEDLCVLNDVRFFDLATRRWLPSAAPPDADALVPKARYAHLSSVTADRLFIIGGQDLSNVWLDDVYVYDLFGKAWVQRRDYPRHCGTYRSVAVSGTQRVRLPQEELRNAQSSQLPPPGSRFKSDKSPSASASQEFTASESLTHLPYSAAPTDEYPNDIYLYSNYNFTDVKRELEVFSPLPETDFTITDRSSAMTGNSFPPGLRFPTGAILGTHFIIAGTYLAHTYQSFSIWALDLLTMTWSRIDPGSAVSSGSWFRGCLWSAANKFLIFGNRNGNLVEDYNRRLLSWDHVAVIDLEAFGIYQPPTLALDIPMQELGLAALEEHVLTDFEIVCDDGRRIRCSRKTLEQRWPWFREERARFLESARQAAESLPGSPMHVGLPDLPGTVPGESRPDPRLTPRAFNLSEPYPITLALLQYFYTLSLLTPLQHAPAVLSQLLVLSSTYNITHLESLVKHAMHRALSNSTSVGVYEVATLCSCRSLQIRALKTVMSYSQKRPSTRTRQDRDGSAGGRNPDPSAGAGSGAGPKGDDMSFASRPRGTSDAHFRGPPPTDSSGLGRGYKASATVSTRQGTRDVGADIGASDLGHPTSPDRAAELEFAGRTTGQKDAKPFARVASQKSSSSSSSTPRPRKITAAMADQLRHARSFSVVSLNTDNDILEVANLMSPSVDVPSHDSFWDSEAFAGDALEVEDEDFDLVTLETMAQPRRPAPRLSVPESVPESAASSVYSESEQSADEREYPHHTTAFPAFHMPRQRHTSSGRDSHCPSLTSSSSGSSSRARSSPPSSPRILATPIDPPAPFGPPHLEMIEELGSETDIPKPYRTSAISTSSAPSISDGPARRMFSRGGKPSPTPTSSAASSPPQPSLPPNRLKPKTSAGSLKVKIYSPAETAKTGRSSTSSLSSGTVSPFPETPTTMSPLQSPPSPASHRTGFSRLLSPKASRTSLDRDRASARSVPTPVRDLNMMDSKALKEEAKRRKKLEMERLALEMSKKRVKAAATKPSKGGMAAVTRNNLEPNAMFGGMAGVTL